MPIEIRVKPGGLKGPGLAFEKMIPRRIVRHGIRVKPVSLAAAFRENGTLRPRVGCSCGWSLDRLTIAPSRSLARKTGRAGG